MNSLLLTLLCTTMEDAALLEMFKKHLVVLNANLEKLEEAPCASGRTAHWSASSSI
jgi:hypothetical protein